MFNFYLPKMTKEKNTFHLIWKFYALPNGQKLNILLRQIVSNSVIINCPLTNFCSHLFFLSVLIKYTVLKKSFYDFYQFSDANEMYA